MSTERGYKRKRFFNYSINKRLQVRMLFKVWAIVFMSLLLAGIIFYLYSNINVGNSFRLFHVKAKNFLEFLLPVLVSGFFASLILGVLIALFFPHAFAGPLYRIEKELAAIGGGDLTKEIKLRKRSEVPELAAAINTMVADLRSQVLKISDVAEEIRDTAQKSSSQGADVTLGKIEVASEKLQGALRNFKL